MKSLEHGRVRIALRELRPGPGPALLAVHGLRGSSEEWGDSLASWKGAVHALDLTGHGESARLAGGAYHPELEGLENTLAAFRHADQLGYGYLETDVHATSDGALLAFHDAVLDRVTDLKGRIESLTLAEVGEALIGGRERVPTLARLFEEFPTARFNIDIKASAAVPLLARFLDENDAWDRVLRFITAHTNGPRSVDQ